MKSFSSDTLAALERGDAIVGGAFKIASVPAIRGFSGYGQISIDSETYEGIGDRALVQVTGGALGGGAQNITLVLSGIDPEMLELLDADEVKQAPTTSWRIIWTGDGKTMLGAYVFNRGRVDKVTSEEVIGGEAVVRAAIENAARGLGRRGGRMRTDADQRLVKATDGFFRNVAFAAEKTLYWGGKKPARAGSAIGGGGAQRGDNLTHLVNPTTLGFD